MLSFLKENRRWLATGLLLSSGSSFGQTYFISFFAGEIRAEYGLSDGAWGLIYTMATLGSALVLLLRGSLADTLPLSRLAPAVAVLYAGAAALMAVGGAVWTLVLAVFLLRFCGQGMFIHIQATAMSRWFVATRGRALAFTNLGLPAGDVVLPLIALALAGALGWRATWGIVSVAILLVITPALVALLAQDRSPQGGAAQAGSPGLGGVHWTRAAVLRHWSFWALVPILLTPGFIGTVMFFHQVHVAEVKGWTLPTMAAGYPVFATTTIGSGLLTGWACDRLGPARLVPVMLLPMAIGVAMVAPADTVALWIVALGVLGLTQGMVGAVFGTLLPWAYGTDHLGSIRAVATATMVLSTAIGPGLTGLAIDWGVNFPQQGIFMALWCVALSMAMVPVMRRILAEP